jgi:hypothetical protein
MICTPCKLAGVECSVGATNLARELHEGCEHPATCACQHRLTSVLETRPKFATGGTIETRDYPDDDIPAILDRGYFIPRS